MAHDEPTDRELVTRFQRGDTAAADVLVDRYQDEVRSYCFAVLDDPGEAEDAVQTTFEKVLRRLPTFEGGEKIRRYIIATARGRCLTATRRARCEGSPIELREYHAIDDQVHDHVGDALNLQVILDALTPREQELLVERHLEEQPLAAMAARRATSTGSVAVMVHRAVESARLIASNRDMWSVIPAAVVARLVAWSARRDHTPATAVAAPAAAAVAAVAAGVLVLAPPSPGPTASTAASTPIEPAAAPTSSHAPGQVDGAALRTTTSDVSPDAQQARAVDRETPAADELTDEVQPLAPIPRTEIPGTDRAVTQDFPDESDHRYAVEVGEAEVAAVDSTNEDHQEPVHDQACPVLDATPTITCTSSD